MKKHQVTKWLFSSTPCKLTTQLINQPPNWEQCMDRFIWLKTCRFLETIARLFLSVLIWLARAIFSRAALQETILNPTSFESLMETPSTTWTIERDGLEQLVLHRQSVYNNCLWNVTGMVNKKSWSIHLTYMKRRSLTWTRLDYTWQLYCCTS